MTSGRGAYLNPKLDGKPSTLGLRIRAIRVAWGWTQTTLAEALGSRQNVVSEWEKDISKPSGATLTALAKLVDLPAKALETGRGFRIPEPPDAKPEGGLMSKRDVQSLKKLLPKLEEGEILQVDTGNSNSELVELKEALEAIRQAQKEGRPVWLVIGKAEGKKAKT